MAQGTTAAAADRYGRRPASRDRYLAVAVATLLTSSLLGWAVWVGWSARTGARWQDGAFSLVDDGHARLAFDVTVAPGRRVVCTVRLFNSGMTEVGRIDVEAGPSAQRTFRVTADVPTFEAATSGTVRACALR